jgi:heptosyltransferase-2
MNITNILIIKPGAIGDLVQLTPVIRALAHKFPGSRISILVGNKATASLFQYNPYVAETMVYDKRGEHQSFRSLLKLRKELKQKNYDLVLNYQRSNLKAWILASASFPCRVLVYHKARLRTIHVVDNYLETVTPLGIANTDRDLEIFVGEEDEQFAEQLFAEQGYIGQPVVALNPGASHPIKKWGLDQFASLADILSATMNAKIVLIGGSEDVLDSAQIAGMSRAKILNVTGKLNLLQLAAVFKKCNLLISSDTGPLHLATAVGTRVLGLFGATDPARTGPVGNRHRVLQASSVDCIPCKNLTCSHKTYHECMRKLSPQIVAAAAKEMIKDH